jgi:hypothetical protein
MNNEIRIAGSLIVKDWEDLQKNLKTDNNKNWGLAFHFFEERVRTRYLNPINAILDMDLNTGEGFAVVNLQCSLIETIESFINGWVYFNDGIKGNPKGWFKRDVSSTTKECFNTNEYIFSSFFKSHFEFNKVDGKEFYFSIRCGLLHETQTKNNWKIKKAHKEDKAYDVLEEFKLIYRENFQRDLILLIKRYKEIIINGGEFDGVPVTELRENFIAKFNYICKQS